MAKPTEVGSMNALRVQAERKAKRYRRALELACNGDADQVAYFVSEADTEQEEEEEAEWEHPCSFRGELVKTPAGEACPSCGLRESHISGVRYWWREGVTTTPVNRPATALQALAELADEAASNGNCEEWISKRVDVIRTALGAKACEPCPRGDDKPEPSCTNRAQCWEPCGELGNSAAHARVGRTDPEDVKRALNASSPRRTQQP